MTEDNIDKRLENWAESEVEVAPNLRPTPEMYKLVESKAKRGWMLWSQPRWIATAGVTLSILVILIIGGLILGDPSAWFGPSSVQQIAFVETRIVPAVLPEPPEKGKSQSDQPFKQLFIQVQRDLDGKIETLDLQNPLTNSVTITNSDNFRLLIQPAQPRYLYIYLLNPNDDFQVLHPETDFNQLHPIETTLLPAPSNWFYLSGGRGIYHLHLITSKGEIPELDRIYNQYIQMSGNSNIEPTSRNLVEYLKTAKTGSAKYIEAWELIITLQD